MTDISPAAVVQRLWALYNDEGLRQIPGMFADDGAWNYAATAMGPAERVTGKAAVRERVEGMLAMFSGIEIEVHQSVAEGDTVASRWTCTFALQGAPEHRLSMNGTSFFVVREGEIAEGFDTWAAPSTDT